MTKSNKTKKIVNKPTDLAKIGSYKKFINFQLEKTNIELGKPYSVNIPDDIAPETIKFKIEEYKSKLFLVKNHKGIAFISEFLNAKPHKVRKIKNIANNNSNTKTISFIEVQFIFSDDTHSEFIKLDEQAWSNIQKFEETIYKHDNRLIFNGDKTALKLLRQKINEMWEAETILLTSSGSINIEGLEGRIYKNAYVNKNGIIWADENGDIILVDGQIYRISEEFSHNIPVLSNCDTSAKFIAKDLLENLIQAFDGEIAPLLALGLGVMGVFASDIWSNTPGFPSGFLYGASKQGKSTIQSIICYIYGFDETFLAMGHSTSKSLARKANLYNNCIIGLNDISSKMLAREYFQNLQIELYDRSIREKLKNGSEFNNLSVNSPMMSSSNFLPVPKEQLLNRTLPVYFRQGIYNPESMLEYYEKPYYLSKLIPEIIKNDWEDVIKKVKANSEELAKNFDISTSRESHNVALGLTGLEILENIADYQIPDMNDKVNAYFEWYLSQFNQLEEPIDIFLNNLEFMLNEGHLKIKQDIKITGDINGIIVEMKHTACLAKFNAFIGKIYPDKAISPKYFSESVKESIFYVKATNKRFKKGKNKSESAYASVLNITDHEFAEQILKAYTKIEIEMEKAKNNSGQYQPSEI